MKYEHQAGDVLQRNYPNRGWEDLCIVEPQGGNYEFCLRQCRDFPNGYRIVRPTFTVVLQGEATP